MLESFAPSTIAATFPYRNLGDNPAFDQLEEVTIKRNGQTMLVGIVQSVEVSNSGSERVWNIVFADCYYYLEHCFALVNEWQPTFRLFTVAKQAANTPDGTSNHGGKPPTAVRRFGRTVGSPRRGEQVMWDLRING